MACETDPCPVFGFLDHLHWDNGEPFMARAAQPCAGSQGFDGPPVLSTTQKSTEETFRLYFLPFAWSTHLSETFGH